MEKLLRTTKHPQLRRVLQNIAAILLAVLVGAGVWLTVDTTARAAFFHWVREVYETHIVYRFGGEAPAGVLPEYRPGWLPDGSREVSAVGDQHSQNILYRDETASGKNSLIFSYDRTYEEMSLRISGYSAVLDIQVNGMPGHFYTAPDGSGSCGLVWVDRNTGIVFELSSFLSMEDMMHIAESLELCKTPK